MKKKKEKENKREKKRNNKNSATGRWNVWRAPSHLVLLLLVLQFRVSPRSRAAFSCQTNETNWISRRARRKTKCMHGIFRRLLSFSFISIRQLIFRQKCFSTRRNLSRAAFLSILYQTRVSLGPNEIRNSGDDDFRRARPCETFMIISKIQGIGGRSLHGKAPSHVTFRCLLCFFRISFNRQNIFWTNKIKIIVRTIRFSLKFQRASKNFGEKIASNVTEVFFRLIKY